MILTPLPTQDEDRFFSKTNGEGAGHGSSKFNTHAKDKSNTNHDHSEQGQDIPKPRIIEHNRPTQDGNNFKAHQHKPSAHYEMLSQASVGLSTISGLEMKTTTKNVTKRKRKEPHLSKLTTIGRSLILMKTMVKKSQGLPSILHWLVLV